MTRLLILALCLLMATPALAQVLTHRQMMCWPRDQLTKQLEVQFEERAFVSGMESRTNIPFTIYVNFTTGTSSYVNFPMKGTACVIGGEQVIRAKREPDL